MSADLTCTHERTPDSCEDCSYAAVIAAGRIQPRSDLVERGPGLAPVLGLPTESTAASPTRKRAARQPH